MGLLDLFTTCKTIEMVPQKAFAHALVFASELSNLYELRSTFPSKPPPY